MSDATERYERLADAFHRETGMMAPGKDQPAEMGGADNYRERWDAWRAWLAKRRGTVSDETTDDLTAAWAAVDRLRPHGVFRVTIEMDGETYAAELDGRDRSWSSGDWCATPAEAIRRAAAAAGEALGDTHRRET